LFQVCSIDCPKKSTKTVVRNEVIMLYGIIVTVGVFP